jgi:hypothetical protein
MLSKYTKHIYQLIHWTFHVIGIICSGIIGFILIAALFPNILNEQPLFIVAAIVVIVPFIAIGVFLSSRASLFCLSVYAAITNVSDKEWNILLNSIRVSAKNGPLKLTAKEKNFAKEIFQKYSK